LNDGSLVLRDNERFFRARHKRKLAYFYVVAQGKQSSLCYHALPYEVGSLSRRHTGAYLLACSLILNQNPTRAV